MQMQNQSKEIEPNSQNYETLKVIPLPLTHLVIHQ
jgi:hypothetical protein